LPFQRAHRLRQQLGRQVQIDTARAARHGGADRPRHADADIFGVQHPVRRLGIGPCRVELVHLLVVALLQIDDLALARAADQNHRETVGGGVGQRRQAVEKPRGRDGQADTGLLGHVARDRRGIAGMLFVTKPDEAHALGLRQARQIGDGNPDQAEDGVDVIELEGIDDEVEAVGGFAGVCVVCHIEGCLRLAFY
jgi:hypothetical protein